MPVTLDLLPRTYLWSTCGMSKNQPFCDGSHAKTEFKPLKFTIPEKIRVALCNCQRTKNAPYCDGSHNSP